MDSLSSHLLPRSRDVEVHQLRLVSPDAGINNVPISSTANTGRGESLPPDFSSRPLFSGSGLALPRSSMQISIPSSSPPPSTATRPSTRPRGGPQSEESEAEAGRVPLSPLDQEALDATLGGVSKFSGLRSLVILVFGLLPLLMEIQLLLPSLTGHLDTRTWVYVHQTLNAEELTESIVVPLSTAQVTFAAQQARRRAQLEQSKAGHEPRPAKSGGETRTPSGGERGGQGDKTEAESRADSLAFQQLGEPFPILLVPQYNSETSLFKQLRLWHFFRKRSAEGENGEGSTEDDQKPRKRLTASPLLPPAPSPASSQGTAASNSYPFPSINGRSVRDSPIFPLAVEASSCTSCLQFFQPGVLPLSVASFPPASSSPFAPAESPSPVGRSGVSEASQEGATRTDLSPGASKSHASSSLPSETPEPVSATDGGVLGEAAVAFEAEREREGEREGERGSSDDKRRLRLGVMIRKHSVSPQESSLASFALPPGDAEQPSPVSPSALSPSSHGPTLFSWVDPEHYDVTPPLLLVYASLVVMMIRWFSLAVRALGEALLLQDDLDPTGAVLSSAAVSKPLRVVGGFSVWALGFCIFPYSLSATQGCMAGDMDGTNIPVPVFYAYFQYSIWVALLLALVARRLSKFFKRRASALEAEARRRRQDAYRAPSSQAAFVSTPGPVGPNSGEASSVSGGERGAESSAYAAQAPSASSSGLPAAAVASLELETQVPREHESPGQDDPASSLSSPSSSLASSAEQSFIQEARTPLRVSFLPPSQDPAATFTAGSLRTSGVEERRNGRGRSRDFTNATLLLMGYRLLIQRLCRRAQTMWSVLMWRRDHLFGSRYHAYREMCSVAAFLLSAHTISGALVVLLGPIQPWMQAVWLHILCMFVEAVARIQIAKGEERAQNARVMAVNPELFAAGGLRRPLFNVGVGARASAAAGGTPWGYAFVEEPRDRLLLKQLSSTYFSIAERIVDQNPRATAGGEARGREKTMKGVKRGKEKNGERGTAERGVYGKRSERKTWRIRRHWQRHQKGRREGGARRVGGSREEEGSRVKARETMRGQRKHWEAPHGETGWIFTKRGRLNGSSESLTRGKKEARPALNRTKAEGLEREIKALGERTKNADRVETRWIKWRPRVFLSDSQALPLLPLQDEQRRESGRAREGEMKTRSEKPDFFGFRGVLSAGKRLSAL
ncbi:conserved hypothetical protein [Neospora caninum Liverpool]|uniref:Transmembrane protein n=1 Tax=Neospora caninum (strain Liverpool) TaxID=572307 RepID=F0VNI2_NEOCL|nr:conserved hypothetical protein [Neospora caninum Liverpool]CBZ55278.1 conserved hypothetical protein [Neospora caninum Liverpool]|eukprot:XP_003885306.1 conserved hypothetical protein [Neospora caninum Liverpool]